MMNNQYADLLVEAIYEKLADSRYLSGVARQASVKWAIRDAINSMEKGK